MFFVMSDSDTVNSLANLSPTAVTDCYFSAHFFYVLSFHASFNLRRG